MKRQLNLTFIIPSTKLILLRAKRELPSYKKVLITVKGREGMTASLILLALHSLKLGTHPWRFLKVCSVLHLQERNFYLRI